MIRFPKLHIAESVANRLLNFHDGLQSRTPIRPSVPEANPAGPALDQRLNTTTAGAAPSDAVVEGAVTDEKPLESIIRG